MGTRIGETTPLGNPAGFDGGLVEVAGDTWAWVQPNGGLGESNAGLVRGDGESLLVDTLWDERLTGAMLATMDEATSAAPIRQLVNTHGDGDHWYGNGLLPVPAAITASAPAIAQMRAEPPSLLTRMAPVAAAAGLIGRIPLMPAGASLRGLAAFNAMAANYDFRGAHPRLPDRQFAEAAVLDVGGRRVELELVGPAHTTGDALVWVPDVEVCFAGDIVFSGVTPIMWAGPVTNWLAALDRIEERQPAVVVGGHGPVAGVDVVRGLRDYWELLRGEVAAAGPDPDLVALAERLIRSPGYEPYRAWDGAERTLVNVARIAATEAGGPSEVSTAQRIRLIAGMGVLGERLAAG
jgi:glyoxylase-like metal-dependent hydrolase (beta-lactamase superfamily II)